MPEKWTGRLLGRMHNERITYDELAAELGFTKSYVSMILNGKRNPDGIRRRMEEAVDRLVERRRTEQDSAPRIVQAIRDISEIPDHPE